MCNSNSPGSRLPAGVFLTIALYLAGCVPLWAQSGGSFQITNSIVAGGGGESRDLTNNRFGHECTVSEHAAGTLLRNPPYSQTAGLWASNVGLTPTASSASISGRILTNSGAPLAGVKINLAGSHSLETITDANGVYSFTDLEVGGFYLITPARENYAFSPRQLSFSLLADKTDAVFTALPGAAAVNPPDAIEFFTRRSYSDWLRHEPGQLGSNRWSGRTTPAIITSLSIEGEHEEE